MGSGRRHTAFMMLETAMEAEIHRILDSRLTSLVVEGCMVDRRDPLREEEIHARLVTEETIRRTVTAVLGEISSAMDQQFVYAPKGRRELSQMLQEVIPKERNALSQRLQELDDEICVIIGKA